MKTDRKRPKEAQAASDKASSENKTVTVPNGIGLNQDDQEVA